MSDADTKAPLPKMTVEQFLAWDSTGHVGKLELVEGQVRAMSPASGTHALVQARLAILVGSRLMARNRERRVAPAGHRFAGIGCGLCSAATSA